jgi:hypothetical protein
LNTRNAIDTRSRKRGSLAVETAIFLPLFIIGVLTLGWLIRMTAISENVFHALSDETGTLAAEAKAPVGLPGFQGAVLDRIEDENGKDVKNPKVTRFLYRVPYIDANSGKAHTDLIAASVAYDTPILLPPIFASKLSASDVVLTRAFVGTDNRDAVFPFDEMERDDGGLTVWVFPRAGERYHGENCAVIKNNPREVILTSAVRHRYAPCHLCKPNTVSDGNLVYVFPAAGGAYHVGSCYIVERYVISVSETDAKEQGYTPCQRCGGK